jgi:hypothetical protein
MPRFKGTELQMKSDQVKNMVILVLVVWVLGLSFYMIARPPVVQVVSEKDTDESDRKNRGGDEATPYERREVKNTIIKNADSIQSCYKELLATSPKIKNGKVVVDWQIGTEGQVISPSVITSEFQDKTMNDCLVKKIGAIEFPPPPDGKRQYISHKFFFKTEETLEAERKARESLELKPAVTK